MDVYGSLVTWELHKLAPSYPKYRNYHEFFVNVLNAPIFYPPAVEAKMRRTTKRGWEILDFDGSALVLPTAFTIPPPFLLSSIACGAHCKQSLCNVEPTWMAIFEIWLSWDLRRAYLIWTVGFLRCLRKMECWWLVFNVCNLGRINYLNCNIPEKISCSEGFNFFRFLRMKWA